MTATFPCRSGPVIVADMAVEVRVTVLELRHAKIELSLISRVIQRLLSFMPALMEALDGLNSVQGKLNRLLGMYLGGVVEADIGVRSLDQQTDLRAPQDDALRTSLGQ